MVQVKETPIQTLLKRAEVQKNRVIIPKWFIDEHGRYFDMELYEDKIILIPRKESK